MKVTVLYIGSSLLAPLKNAERELNRDYNLGLSIAACNFGSPLSDREWVAVENDLQDADLVFIIHVMDGENAARLLTALEKYRTRHAAVIVINCMPDLMRRTRMGRLNISQLLGGKVRGDKRKRGGGKGEGQRSSSGKALGMLTAAGSWIGSQVRGRRSNNQTKKHGHGQYLKLIDKLPGILRFVPTAGGLRDVKHYLNIFCYFLQPTPANIRSMILYALKEYVADERLKKARIEVPPPQHLPSVAIYHPDAPHLFESFEDYRKWYVSRSPKSAGVQLDLNPDETVGLLLMRPQVVSKTTRHYDALIRAIEAEGLSVIPALSTLMDNREACQKFFVEDNQSKVQSLKSKSNKANTRPIGQIKILYVDDFGPWTSSQSIPYKPNRFLNRL